VTPTSW